VGCQMTYYDLRPRMADPFPRPNHGFVVAETNRARRRLVILNTMAISGGEKKAGGKKKKSLIPELGTIRRFEGGESRGARRVVWLVAVGTAGFAASRQAEGARRKIMAPVRPCVDLVLGRRAITGLPEVIALRGATRGTGKAVSFDTNFLRNTKSISCQRPQPPQGRKRFFFDTVQEGLRTSFAELLVSLLTRGVRGYSRPGCFR